MPIACGQTISQPYVVAYMTEQLHAEPQHSLLEIGTGSGYQAAVLSRVVRQVTSIERDRTLAQGARTRLAALGYDNVEVIAGDGLAGAPDRAPFDRIIVTAAAEEIRRRWSTSLRSAAASLRCCSARTTAASRPATGTEKGVAREDLIACASCRCCRGRRENCKNLRLFRLPFGRSRRRQTWT